MRFPIFRLTAIAFLIPAGAAAQPVADSARGPAYADSILAGAGGGGAGWRRWERGFDIGVLDASRDRLANAPTLPLALQARLPGVSVSQGEGMLGSPARVWLRGPSSMHVNEPLLIIDGVRTHASEPFRGFVSRGLPSRLEDIDPETIERIEILRGAAASTIYGPGASKGVILVTTRRGRPGAARWTAFAEAGPMMETTTFPSNFGTIGVATSDGSPVANCPLAAQAAGTCTPVERQSWNPLEDASPFRTGWSKGAGLSASGGTGSLTYLAAAGHDRASGVYETNNSQATNGRLNLTLTVNPSIEVGVRAGYRADRLRLPTVDYITGGLFGAAVDDPVRRGYASSIADAERGRREEDTRRTTLALNGEWRPRSWLRTTAVVGYDRLTDKDDMRVRSAPFRPDGQPVTDSLTVINLTGDRPEARTGALEAAASYAFRGAAARSSIGIQYLRDDDRASSLDSVASDLGETAVSKTWWNQRNSTTGIYVQQHMNWRARTFATASVRIDRSGGGDHDLDIDFSPSVDVSWIAIDPAAGQSGGGIDGLRLRAAYGRGGGHVIPSVRLTGSFTGIPSDKTVERMSELELGADALLFASRVSAALTAYLAVGDRGLYSTTPPPSGGGGPSTILTHGARIRTSGIEGAFDARMLEGGWLTWDLGLIIAAHRNEVGRLPGPAYMSADGQITQTGGSLGEYYATSYTFNDVNGDGLIGANEISYSFEDFPAIGSPSPEYEAALRSEATIGGRLRIAALVDRRSGMTLLDRTSRQRCRTRCEEQHDPATPLAEQARTVALLQGAGQGGFLKESGYTKLREASATLFLPHRWATLAGASEARFTLTGRNLFTWTSYPGLDPEITSRDANTIAAADAFYQPPLRSFTARLDLSW